MRETLAIGIDLGTSGARAVAMTPERRIVARAAARFADLGADPRAPGDWWQAVETALGGVLDAVDKTCVRAVSVDATSGTLLAVDQRGTPIAPALMYDDRSADASLLTRIAPLIPQQSAAHGATSGLVKALALQAVPGVERILHQADWIAGRLTGDYGTTDENNALKTGYDPLARRWPAWMAETGLKTGLLPEVVEPGTPLGRFAGPMARAFGLDPEAIVVAGTTDGCASFLATGAHTPGDGVSALGSTLTVKLLGDRPIFAPGYGIYSHRINGMWLAGGASNSGGRVLAHFFAGAEIERLSERIDPATATGLDFYPLLEPGERFPVMDRTHPPRLEPRPADDAEFLKAMFEGIAAIEKLGYDRLAELGAPPLRSIRTVGGGAGNPAWTRIRQRALGVPFLPAHSDEAAAGTAGLALAGLRSMGALR
ncbi:FGGY-family carbohydrate kinase [Nitratireductor sp. ZSWI3]|uniref:FGGY-family carbohydrate kinase n=1 Tax=Nitratireductor sp. ZSWI3 TaxID=2966359 RepID=UPI00214FB76C|nr:FGGY-family carbohydrate kinase [Nitratireductor sp. ZSWI3]MCR4266153.1 FGGY-family carbohydrate kinase [Nitratireductor sp. ZSWI3]